MKRFAIIALLLTSPAVAGEAVVPPRVPTEQEKADALRLGYILNGFSMTRDLSEGSIDVGMYRKPLILPSTLPPAVVPDEQAPDGVWPPAPKSPRTRR